MLSLLKNKNIIVTASPNNGSTSFVLKLLDLLLTEDISVLYYSPYILPENSFVKKYYKNVYNNTFFISGTLDTCIRIILDNVKLFNYIVIDPADTLLDKHRNILKNIIQLGSKVICTSQIRQNAYEGGKIYSTIEEFNKKEYAGGNTVFDRSIWIRNVNEVNILFKRKYLEIYKIARYKYSILKRYIIEYTKEGNINETNIQ